MPSTISQPGAAPLVVPPSPPTRPESPVIDPSLRLPLVTNVNVKSPLAWRSKAWKLASEPDDPTAQSHHPSCLLSCTPEEALNAAAESCRTRGGQIVGQSLSAGQLGARFGDSTTGRALVIIVVRSIGNNRTILKASIEPERSQRLALLNDLMNQTAAIINGKGLL
jgi:hypothetical protein